MSSQQRSPANPPSASSSIPHPSVRHRMGRNIIRQPLDEQPHQSFGDSVYQKEANDTRIFFQNVKGLTHSASGEDYAYYLSTLHSLNVEISGLAETNSAWSHVHLQSDFKHNVKKQYGNHRVSFGHPSLEVDPPHHKETYQAGGSLTLATGGIVSYLHGSVLVDPSGLGRWSGITIRGAQNQYLSIITAYRTCTGSIRTAPIGSTFHREYEYYRRKGISGPRPRTLFLQDLKTQIQELQSHDNSVILMLDANATLESDVPFAQMLSECDLRDLHASQPAPSTYMGAANRRIDFIFGCTQVEQAVNRRGTLSYYEGPQADHRGIF